MSNQNMSERAKLAEKLRLIIDVARPDKGFVISPDSGFVTEILKYLGNEFPVDGAERILKERHVNQIEKHGYTGEYEANHPEFYDDGQLIEVAVHLIEDFGEGVDDDFVRSMAPHNWDKDKFLKYCRYPLIKRLEIAGAMIAAEIDRIEANSVIKRDQDQNGAPKDLTNGGCVSGKENSSSHPAHSVPVSSACSGEIKNLVHGIIIGPVGSKVKYATETGHMSDALEYAISSLITDKYLAWNNLFNEMRAIKMHPEKLPNELIKDRSVRAAMSLTSERDLSTEESKEILMGHLSKLETNCVSCYPTVLNYTLLSLNVAHQVGSNLEITDLGVRYLRALTKESAQKKSDDAHKEALESFNKMTPMQQWDWVNGIENKFMYDFHLSPGQPVEISSKYNPIFRAKIKFEFNHSTKDQVLKMGFGLFEFKQNK